MTLIIPAPPQASLPVRGSDARFPVRRIYCVGRNFADHATEMGASVDRGNPVFEGSIGWLECSLIETFDLGDSTALLGAVVENHRLTDDEPLVWSKLVPTLPRATRDQWDAKMARDIEHYRALMHWLT